MSVLINSNGVRHNSGAVEGVPDVAPSPERTTREPSDRAVHHVVAVDEAIDVDEGNPPCCMKFEPWFEAKVEPHVLVPKTRKNWITFAIFWSCVVGIAVWFSVWGESASTQACMALGMQCAWCIRGTSRHSCRAWCTVYIHCHTSIVVLVCCLRSL